MQSERGKMTEKTKKPRTTTPKNIPVPTSVAPFALKFIELEIQGGRSQLFLALIGTIHLNDFLHSAGLITDDAWNQVKGIAALFTTTTNATAFIDAVGNTLTTLVEGVTHVETAGLSQAGQTERAQISQATELAKLAAVKAGTTEGA